MLDVKFQVGERVFADGGVRNFRGIQAKVFDGRANGNSVCIAAAQEIGIETADQSAAADEGQTETDAFLFGES